MHVFDLIHIYIHKYILLFSFITQSKIEKSDKIIILIVYNLKYN